MDSRKGDQMTHANEPAIRAAYADISSGRLDLMASFLTDDITWQITGSSPVSGTYRGREEIFGLFAKVMDVYGGTFEMEIRDVVASDDYGFVIAVERGIVGGELLEFGSVHVWRMRAGKCASFISYEDDNYHQFWAQQLQRAVSPGI